MEEFESWAQGHPSNLQSQHRVEHTCAPLNTQYREHPRQPAFMSTSQSRACALLIDPAGPPLSSNREVKAESGGLVDSRSHNSSLKVCPLPKTPKPRSWDLTPAALCLLANPPDTLRYSGLRSEQRLQQQGTKLLQQEGRHKSLKLWVPRSCLIPQALVGQPLPSWLHSSLLEVVPSSGSMQAVKPLVSGPTSQRPTQS